jgi:hypothetical protein
MADTRRGRKSDHTSTRIISHREVTVDGVQFRWWAVGEHPSLVTVRTAVFGSLAEFTYHDCSAFARSLAQKLLAQHYQPTQTGGTRKKARANVPALEKAGWFEVEPAEPRPRRTPPRQR